MSNVIPLHPRTRSTRPTHTPAHTLRADCERLMRRLVSEHCAYDHELRDLAHLLDVMIERVERL